VSKGAALLFSLLLVTLFATSCGTPEPPTEDNGGWAGTITTEGDVTTVVNESGSVWSGTAKLVEEASIGVASGAEEYLFGHISSLYATDDRIYVVDDQVPTVRAYDQDGRFARTFGRRGQGPGEYDYPGAVAADTSGRVYVRDNRHARVNVYTADGDVLDSWPKPLSICCLPMYPLPGDAVWAAVMVDVPGSVMRGAQAFGPAGPLGEPLWLPDIDYERATYEHPSGREGLAPFSPQLTWTLTPDGRLVVGTSDRYRFELHGRHGTELVVERDWQPVAVAAEHQEWARRLEIAFQRDLNRAELNLSASQLPDHQPAFFHFTPALSGEMWVLRLGESQRLQDCAGDPLDVGYRAARGRPCWEGRPMFDVFSADGRYLGDVDVPEGVAALVTHPFIDGRRVTAVYESEAGTLKVKRYRLVLPGEDTQ